MLRLLFTHSLVAIVALTTSLAFANPGETPVPEPVPAPAPETRAADRPGVSVGLRLAWGFPIGSVRTDDSLGSNFSGILPIWFDAGYRISPAIYLGGYFKYGFGFISQDVCVAPFTACSGDDVRFGVNVHVHLRSVVGTPSWVFDPWVGIGTGYEIATVTLERGVDKSHVSYRGFEFASAQLGGDYLGFGSMRIGGFASFSLGQYSRTTVSVPTGPISDSIGDPAIHAWLMLGLRGQYDF
jgi:hypothetical protein